jgi:hypothetical protein
MGLPFYLVNGRQRNVRVEHGGTGLQRFFPTNPFFMVQVPQGVHPELSVAACQALQYFSQ